MTSLNSKDRNNYNNTMGHSHSHLIKLIYFKFHAQYSQECGFMGSWEPMDFQRVPWYHLELLKHRHWNLRIKIPHYGPIVSQERKFLGINIFHRLKTSLLSGKSTILEEVVQILSSRLEKCTLIPAIPDD